MPASPTKNARYTSSTASPRGMRPRWTNETAGLRISAMSPAMMNSNSTLPAAFASAQAARTRQRQRDELHPARNDDTRRLGRLRLAWSR